ncbi:unnamed protein product [Malus baccata var. baccata]
MWYLLWKHKMLKMSTREQCQVRTRAKEKIGKKVEYFVRLRWECPLKYEEGLSIFAEAAMSHQDNICCPSFLSPTGPLTVRDSVMKNDLTTAVMARNLLTPKDNRLLSKQSDELAVKDSLAFSVQLAHDYATNMKRKLEQIQESDGQILLDHQSIKAPNDHPLVPSLSGALLTAETSPKQPL